MSWPPTQTVRGQHVQEDTDRGDGHREHASRTIPRVGSHRWPRRGRKTGCYVRLMVDEMPERILMVMAHPDDVDFGAAGSVATWTDAGADVVLLHRHRRRRGWSRP